MHLRTTFFVASFASALAFVGFAQAGEHAEHAAAPAAAKPAGKAPEQAAAGKPAGKPAEVEMKAKEAEKGAHEKGEAAGKDKDDDKLGSKAEHAGDDDEDDADKEAARPWKNLKKKEERLEALKAKMAERDKEFAKRLESARIRLRAEWGLLANSPEVVAELKQHAERSARLRRIRDLAEVEGQADIAKRAEAALKKEHERHEAEEAKLKGGHPSSPNASPSGQAHAAPGSAVNPAASAKGGAQ